MSIGPLTGPLGVSRKEVVVIENNPTDPSKSRVVIREYSPFNPNAVINEEFIDMRLAPGNPQLAAQIHEDNKAKRAGELATAVAPGLAGAKALGFFGSRIGLPSATKIIEGIKGTFVQPKRVPLTGTTRTTRKGNVVGQQGGVFLDPSKIEPTSITKGIGTALPFVAGYGLLQSAQTEPLTGDDLKQAVEDAKITQSQGKEIKDQLNIVGDINKPSNVIATTETDVVDDTEDINKDTNTETDENASDKDNIKTLEDVGQERFIDPDALIAFVRNVGAGLSTTGQFGSGLSLGSKMAAEERAKRDILEEQEQKKIQKEKDLLETKFEYDKKLLEMKGTAPALNAKEVATQSTKLSEEITAFNISEQARGLVEASIMVLQDAINSGEKLTGVPGFFNKLQDQVQALIGTQQGFEGLTARTKIDKLSEIVKLSNAREILNDQRLSNYERQILGDAFGELKTLEDPSIALSKFTNSLTTLKNSNKARQDLIKTLHDGLFLGGETGQNSFARTAPEVSKIQKIDLDISTAVETLNRLIQGQEFGTNVIGLVD
jgi:hypothetical protein